MSTSTPPVSNGDTLSNRKRTNKRQKNILKTAIILTVIAAVIVFCLIRTGVVEKNETNHQATLQTFTVGTRSITEVLTSSGTIEPNDQYTISALVSGEIIEDYFEKGDTVIEDQLLFEIDSDSLNSGVTRAENALKNANKNLEKALEDLEKLNVTSEVSGSIKNIYVEIGDEIKAGDLIADIVDDEVMCADIPFMTVDTQGISVGDPVNVTFENYE